MKSSDVLVYLNEMYQADWNAINDVIHRRAPLSATPEEIEAFAASLPTRYVTLGDPDYPQSLSQGYKPPWVLYYQGNLDLIKDIDRAATFVGARKCGDYGRKMARELAEGVAKQGVAVVSGLAAGIDSECLKAALPFGKAVAVLGNGLNKFYPSANEELQKEIARTGLLLSEYPFECPPTAKHFPLRNRILAALGKVTVVIEAQQHSGTMITAAFAAALGRDIGAVPFHADEESSCNGLIREGAALVEKPEDVLDIMGYNAWLRGGLFR